MNPATNEYAESMRIPRGTVLIQSVARNLAKMGKTLPTAASVNSVRISEMNDDDSEDE